MKVRDILQDCSEWIPGERETEDPIVSVILPTFRRAKSGLFEKAVRSVLEQDLKDLELIIIDDASTDGTAKLIESFMKDDSRVSCIRHKYNIGLPAISEYEGLLKARGEYIAFIFDDNEWEKNYLSSTVDFMKCNHAEAAYGRMYCYYGNKKDEYLELGIATSKIGMQTLDATNYIANAAVILSKKVLYDKRVGLYDPHVAVIRVCDWGLWKRLVRYYEFFETGILAGKELGVIQADSLGNTYKLSHWSVAEREQEVLLGELAPENFLEVEINKISERSTELYQNTVQDFYQDFSDKKWYKEEKLTIDKKMPRLRILVLASEYNATLYLSFFRLFYLGKDFIFCFGNEDTSTDKAVFADVVILVRDLVKLEKFEIFCKEKRIPYYYYVDDNFIELHKDYKESAWFEEINNIMKTERISGFEGIFTSSPCLSNFFIENNFHFKIWTLEPSIDFENISNFNAIENKYLTIAFMGGDFRSETLRQVVMPALEKLSEKYFLQVIYPEEIDLQLFINKKMKLIGIKRENSLDLALKHYSRYKPNILIHCGIDLRNNTYKTLNALINAVQLGAVLVVSDVLPYTDNELKNKAFLCVKNDSLNWERALDDLLSDVQQRETIYTCAMEYCIQRYSYRKGEKILHEAFSGLIPLNDYEIICRLRGMIYELRDAYGKILNMKKSRSLSGIPLAFTGGIKKNKKYYIRCRSDVFSELGICFASYGHAVGSVCIGIWKAEEQLRECVVDLEEYVHDGWTYIGFDYIQNSENQVYIITLDFEYEGDSALVGVFEDATKKNFITKVKNKIGIPLKILDLLYVDCR